MRVIRIYHSGRASSHRERDRQLTAAGVEVTLVVPSEWADADADERLPAEPFRVLELPVKRPGDVNRHAYADASSLGSVIRELQPDVLDVHEEPFSLVARQVLRATPAGIPVVMYTAQNIDKRFPPPFARYETAALARVAGLYPCSLQAASVARGKGYGGLIEVLPLGYDDSVFFPGRQAFEDDDLVLGFFGRLVPEKGLLDAVRLLDGLNRVRPARLVVGGTGSDEEEARRLAARLGLADRLSICGWTSGAELAELYRSTHVVLVPSRPTATWVEQFGRVIVEAQASGAVVAGYDSGTIREVGGEAAVLAPAGALEELTASVIRLASDGDEFARRRALGLAVNEERTWKRVAERQAALYGRVVAGDEPRLALPASPRARRTLARAEFGPTAQTAGGDRPFALAMLREGGIVSRALGSAFDRAAELRAQARQRGRHHR